MPKPRRTIAVLTFCLIATGAGPARAEDQRARDFELTVRPVLIGRCVPCHGPDKQKGRLRLDTLAAAREGGQSGPAVVPGDPDASFIVEAVRREGLEMPPDEALAAGEVEAIVAWVERGAVWPGPGGESEGEAPAPRAGTDGFTAEDRAYWAFQPVTVAAPPGTSLAGWTASPIDRFIGATLDREGLTPAPEADRRTLLRRLSFDLTGLPPTALDVARFEADGSPLAVERLIDRLLASPAYGERWGRHWLDLVRYAESNGFRADEYRPETWRYRDYVIASLNADKPYDRFVREQLAGDELAPDDPEARTATQYLRLWTYESNQRDVVGQWSNILNDLTDVTADVFLGMGMACARCHDHKYDPIKQGDYFRMRAFFAPLIPVDARPLAALDPIRGTSERRAAWEVATADVRARLDAFERPEREAAERDAVSKLPPEIKAILARPASERSSHEAQLAAIAFRQVELEWSKLGDRFKGEAKETRETLLAKLASFDALRPAPVPTPEQVGEVDPPPPTTIPGDRSGRVIKPGPPTLIDASTAETARPGLAPGSSGRRTALADWIVDPGNPIAARVMANRVWQYHFGRGLVETSSDFGRLGVPPSHPELLDWLARRLIGGGWSLKALHREVLLSRTYRQASIHPEAASALLVDPGDRFLWHFPARRLEAESIRDALLAASGELDRTGGGPGVEASAPRRSVYLKVMRNRRDPLLEAFDAPDGYTSTSLRNLTVSPTQSLLMINGPWVFERAGAMASNLLADESSGDEDRVDRAFLMAYSRPPSPVERDAAMAFLARASGEGDDEEILADSAACETDRGGISRDAWRDLVHVLLNSSEFLYVD